MGEEAGLGRVRARVVLTHGGAQARLVEVT